MSLCKYIIFALLFCICSCANMESGKYVKLNSKDSIASLSQEFNVPQWKLESANKGKKFKRGEWVYVPMKRGFLRNGGRGPASIASYAREEGFAWPVPSSKKVSSGYGKRWGRPHEGIDISGKSGAHIVSTQDGVVVYSGNEYGGYGNIVIVAHKYGFFSIYAHNHKNYVRKGQKVYKGQVIALLGNTGRSTGPHLHFELRRDSKSFNPMLVFNRSTKSHYAFNNR